MSAKLPNFWRMTQGKIVEGVFAVNKPTGQTSAQVLRDLQHHFQHSKLFQPWLELQKTARGRETHNQRNRRREKAIKVKIGHGGTLDPLATGVLIAGVGKGTKSLTDFLLCTKVYDAIVLFGTSTDTYDRVGKVLRRAPYDHITKEMVEKALEQFRGKFMQLPPIFSALKMNGKPLYEYAREGKEIPREIERRQVEVLNLELVEWMEGGTHNHVAPTDEAGYAEVNVANKLWKQENALPAGTSPAGSQQPESRDGDGAREEFERKKRKLSEDQDDLVTERPASKFRKSVSGSDDAMMSGGLTGQVIEESLPSTAKGPPAVRLRMTVTSGFYVRSLCHDLGAAIGSAALMAELERSRQGEFELGKNVIEREDFEKGEEVWGPKVEKFLDEWEQRGNSRSSQAGENEASGSGEPKTTKAETITKSEDIKPESVIEAEKSETADIATQEVKAEDVPENTLVDEGNAEPTKLSSSAAV